MENNASLRIPLLAAIAAACLGSSPARAEITNCINITSLPATISSQGVYCMKQHIATSLASGAAITVTVNNVTIDCNDYKIGNLSGGIGTQANGIVAAGRTNVTIRNCGIRGFLAGVSLTNGEYRVEDNRFDSNTWTAVMISGDGSAVRRNEILDTGASTVPALVSFHGIWGSGDIDVTDNTINNVVATNGGDGSVFGIYTQQMNGGTVRGNRVRNLAADGAGVQGGIWNDTGNRVTVEGNTVVMGGGLLGNDAGIRCGDELLLNGASRGNTVLGTGLVGEALGLVNCVPAGGDFVNPL